MYDDDKNIDYIMYDDTIILIDNMYKANEYDAHCQCDTTSSNDVCQIIDRNQKITNVVIRNLDSSVISILEFISKINRIKALEVTGLIFYTTNIRLFEYLEHLTNIKKFTINDIVCKSKFDAFVKQLHELKIKHYYNTLDSEIHSTILNSTLTKLSLILHYPLFDSDGSGDRIKQLFNHPTIQNLEIEVDYRGITSEKDVCSLFEGLSESKIKHFKYITNSSLHSGEEFASIISKSKLTHFSFDGRVLSNSIINAVASHNTIKHFDFESLDTPDCIENLLMSSLVSITSNNTIVDYIGFSQEIYNTNTTLIESNISVIKDKYRDMMQRNRSYLKSNIHAQLTELVLIFHHLPPYIILELFDNAYHIINPTIHHRFKVDLIYSLIRSIEACTIKK